MTTLSRAILDSHTFLWFATNDAALSERARACIMDVRVRKLVSAATIWELAIKVGIGKLKLQRPFAELTAGVGRSGFGLLPVLPAHANRLISLPHFHRDPFDRLIVAQALVEDCMIVGRDAHINAYGVRRLW
jgi:PIN domain nuclease of toxin-antitoxin system